MCDSGMSLSLPLSHTPVRIDGFTETGGFSGTWEMEGLTGKW